MSYNTEKRALLLEFLSDAEAQCFTIEEICKSIIPDGHGKSTVYRLLSKLVSEGEVRKVSDEKTGRFAYQYIKSGRCAEHFHLKCKNCGKLIHLDSKTSSLLEKRIRLTEDFILDVGAFIYGKCKSCAQTEVI